MGQTLSRSTLGMLLCWSKGGCYVGFYVGKQLFYCWGYYGCYIDSITGQIMVIRVWFRSNVHGIWMNQVDVYGGDDLQAWLGHWRHWVRVHQTETCSINGSNSRFTIRRDR
ncbi:hypothetical protein R6Q59_029263 [Mikania micrantha]